MLYGRRHHTILIISNEIIETFLKLDIESENEESLKNEY